MRPAQAPAATHVIGARTFLSAWRLRTQPMRTRMSALLLQYCAPDRHRELRPRRRLPFRALRRCVLATLRVRFWLNGFRRRFRWGRGEPGDFGLVFFGVGLLVQLLRE